MNACYIAILYTLPNKFYIAISLALAAMLESCCTLAVFHCIGLSAILLLTLDNKSNLELQLLLLNSWGIFIYRNIIDEWYLKSITIYTKKRMRQMGFITTIQLLTVQWAKCRKKTSLLFGFTSYWIVTYFMRCQNWECTYICEVIYTRYVGVILILWILFIIIMYELQLLQ